MDNYYDIMKEYIRVCEAEDVDKQELVLELDFRAKEGSAPALRDPPEFKVGITSRYLRGDCPDESSWFPQGSDEHEKNSGLLACLNDHYRRMTSNHLLTLSRYASGTINVSRLSVTPNVNAVSLFSDDAFDAFSRALRNDDSRLDEVFGSKAKYIAANRDLEIIRMRMQHFTTSEQTNNGLDEFAG